MSSFQGEDYNDESESDPESSLVQKLSEVEKDNCDWKKGEKD